jgi:pyruvate-formate lyase-activating enzyme
MICLMFGSIVSLSGFSFFSQCCKVFCQKCSNYPTCDDDECKGYDADKISLDKAPTFSTF